MANSEQKEGWNGESGAEWVRLQANFDGMLEPWLEVIAKGAAIQPGERILDVGCGTGTTTLAAADRTGPDGRVVGVDLSGPMIARASERAQADGVTNVDFVVRDAQEDQLRTGGDAGDAYDVAISRFGVMFFDDPVAAFANIGRAMQPDGRLAVVVWSPMVEQQWVTAPMAQALKHLQMPDLGGADGPGMFALDDPDRTSGILHQAGWRDVEIEREQRGVLFGGGGTVDEAVDFLQATGLGRGMVADAEPDAIERGLAAIRTVFEEHSTPRGVEFDATAWLMTARR